MIKEYTKWIQFAPSGQTIIITNELNRSLGNPYLQPPLVNEIFQRTFKYNLKKDTCRILNEEVAEQLELDEKDIKGSIDRWLALFNIPPVGSVMMWKHLDVYEVGIKFEGDIFCRHPLESFRIPNVMALEMGLCKKLDAPEPRCLCNRLDAKNIENPQVVSGIKQGEFYREHDLLYPSPIVAFGRLIYEGPSCPITNKTSS